MYLHACFNIIWNPMTLRLAVRVPIHHRVRWRSSNCSISPLRILPRPTSSALQSIPSRLPVHGQGIVAFHQVSSKRQPVVEVANGHKPADDEPLAEYTPAKTGILSIVPKTWVPYGELIRIDKPAGTYYLFFPCLFSTLLAAPMAEPIASFASVATTAALFFSGALIMRGAGCTINDLWDRNLDPHVRRTRLRPIARGAITPFKGVVFTGFQLLAGLAVLVQFPLPCLAYGIPSLALVTTYPLAKRVTYYPQAVLGLAFSWGAIMGFPALGIDLLSNSAALTAAACLYASNIAWVVLYDMIYAHMDIKDDANAGIKSIALKHEHQTKQVLTGLAVTQVALLGAAGMAAGAGPIFFLGSCGGALVTLGVMIRRVNLKSVKNCWWWFVNGCWITGGVVSIGMAADYIARSLEETDSKSTSEVRELDA
jgi:4-hydroxybenzoate polyprenyltransferase